MNNIICKQTLRREKIRQQTQLNGLDYVEVEVEADQTTLIIHLLGKAKVKLDASNIRIEGGQRIRDIKVSKVKITPQESVDFDDIIKVVVDKSGDYSNYTLRIIEQNEQGDWLPHSQFDKRYDRVTFNFKVDCPNELDCKQDGICEREARDEPEINYLAKDYASFRQLILDRLALVMPQWQESHVPDIGIALVEVLAYVGDHLSYYQDAVATEAYLDTARQRISVRRHARLVDYRMHEGCNARAWLCLQVDFDLPAFSADKIQFIAGFDDPAQSNSIAIQPELWNSSSNAHYPVFEAITDTDITLYKDHNRIEFYTWGDHQCCLAKGAISATLVGEWVPPELPDHDSCGDTDELAMKSDDTDQQESTGLSLTKLHLRIGDVLIIEEVIGPNTGHPQDANPKHRQAVRIKTISPDIDTLTGQHLVNISWCQEDALLFPLCLSSLSQAPDCLAINNVSIACANVILVDHGHSVDQELEPVPEADSTICCQGEKQPSEVMQVPGHYHPALKFTPLTFCQPYLKSIPTSQSLAQDCRQAIAKIALQEIEIGQQWQSKLDLLASLANDLHFVAELDEEGRAHLRFGDGEMGRRPAAGQQFKAHYRIGNGAIGNVGAEAITHVLFSNETLDGISAVRNPLPAQGGTDQEPITEVKLYAPQAFRKDLQRAIIADDYAAIVLREFKHKVQNTVAKLQWNGSWYEVMVAIDALGQEQADQVLLDEISARLYRYRRMGHDLVVKSAQRVPLEIELSICVLPDYLRGHVKAELMQLFSNKSIANNKLGFFHPDNLTFGDDIYLSKLVAVAQSVVGVASVTVTKMQRWCESANNEIEDGVLALAVFEIARLDNDPNYPENGKLNLAMRGGR